MKMTNNKNHYYVISMKLCYVVSLSYKVYVILFSKLLVIVRECNTDK